MSVDDETIRVLDRADLRLEVLAGSAENANVGLRLSSPFVEVRIPVDLLAAARIVLFNAKISIAFLIKYIVDTIIPWMDVSNTFQEALQLQFNQSLALLCE